MLLAGAAFSVLMAIPWPQNLFLVAAGAVFVIAAVNPSVGLGVLTASVPLQAVGEQQLGPIHLTITKVILMAMLSSWVGRTLIDRRRIQFDRLALFQLLYVVVLAVTIVNAPDRAAWGAELYRWWTPLVVYLIAINSISSLAEATPIIVGTSIGTIATSIVGFVQVVGGFGPESFHVNGFTRAFATFGQPNPFAGYLDVTVPLLLAIAGSQIVPESPLSPRLRLEPVVIGLCAVGAACGAVSIILTQSRGGWVGASIGIACVAWLLGNVIRWTAVALGIAALAVVVMTPTGQKLTDRFDSGFGLQSNDVLVTPANFAVQERIAHWRAGIAMAKSYPFLGVGAGNYSDRYREFTQVWRFRISRGHAHNAYIQAAAQSGFVGLAFYLSFIGMAVAQMVRALQASVGRVERPLVVGAVGITAAFVVHNMFDYLHVLSLPLQLSMVWALANLVLRGNGANVPRLFPVVAPAPAGSLAGAQ